MSVENIVHSQRTFFHTNKTKDVSYRKEMLRQLLYHIDEKEELIYEALKNDLNKCPQEALMTEIYQIKSLIRENLKNIDKWAKPEKRKTPATHFGAKSFVYKEPYGVVLILAPWNYPFYLSLAPLITAIAAGNCVVLKMSRKCKQTYDVMYTILNETFMPNYVSMLDFDVEYAEIMSTRYDYIFFTGSQRVARIIMRQACEFLTPITLELGGKNPCIIDKNVDLKSAAKKIAWGKLINAGQTCVAPDYCMVPVSLHDDFVELLKEEFNKMIPNALQNEDYGKIVNLHHYIRLKTAIENYKGVIGGEHDDKKYRIAPAIFPNASFGEDIMQSEIFGPILPVIPYDDLNDVITYINQGSKPLACYAFGKSSAFQKKILREISFGGGCINNTMMHAVNEYLPFGGVGDSGMGKYHGKEGFDIFTNEKAVHIDPKIDIPLRYPPYTSFKTKLIKFILKEKGF